MALSLFLNPPLDLDISLLLGLPRPPPCQRHQKACNEEKDSQLDGGSLEKKGLHLDLERGRRDPAPTAECRLHIQALPPGGEPAKPECVAIRHLNPLACQPPNAAAHEAVAHPNRVGRSKGRDDEIDLERTLPRGETNGKRSRIQVTGGRSDGIQSNGPRIRGRGKRAWVYQQKALDRAHGHEPRRENCHHGTPIIHLGCAVGQGDPTDHGGQGLPPTCGVYETG